MTTQVRISPPGDPVCRAMSAETMKIPEPIMDPITIVVQSRSFSPLTSSTGRASEAAFGVGEAAAFEFKRLRMPPYDSSNTLRNSLARAPMSAAPIRS